LLFCISKKEGLVLELTTIAAKVNEISNLEAVLKNIDMPKNAPIFADKGYQSEKKIKF